MGGKSGFRKKKKQKTSASSAVQSPGSGSSVPLYTPPSHTAESPGLAKGQAQSNRRGGMQGGNLHSLAPSCCAGHRWGSWDREGGTVPPITALPPCPTLSGLLPVQSDTQRKERTYLYLTLSKALTFNLLPFLIPLLISLI